MRADRATAGRPPPAHGLADPAVRRAVVGCADVAARRGPEELRPELEAYAELLASGRTPASELRAPWRPPRARSHLLEEEARA